MKKKEIEHLKGELDEMNRQKGFLSSRIDKMSIHFVLPLVLFYAVVGVLLILLEDLVTDVASWALAIGIALIGAWLLLRYFRSNLEERIAGTDLAVGLILLLAGVLLMCSPNDLEEIFPKIWGLSLIFGAFLKIQYAFDEKSVHIRRWWIMLIFAAVSLTIGILTMLKESIFRTSQHLFIGIFMIGEAVLDLVTYLLITRGMKKKNAGPETDAIAEAPMPLPAAQPEPEPQPEQTPET